MSMQVFGQTFTGGLTGVATDPSGAVIAGAKAQLTNTDTHARRTAQTGSDGRYTFSQLLPGPYQLSVQAPGFKTFVQENIQLTANQTAEVNASLPIGAASQSVTITAAPPLLNTQTAGTGVNLSHADVQSLPLDTRTPFGLIVTTGSFTEHGNFKNSTGDQNFDRFSLNGGRTESTQILVNGVPDTTGSQWNGLIYSPTLGSVQEMNISRNNYDAQFGRSGGATISIVTKGGSNQFHGAAFEYLRNSALDANNFFNNKSGHPKPFFGQNQFGGYLGGPIWKSKRLFFFGSYEGFRQGSPSTRLTSVPTDLQRQGDFSQTYNRDGTLQTIYNPFTTRLNSTGSGYIRDPFPGNVIPAPMFDAVGAKVLALYPKPNQPGDPVTSANNWFGTGKSINRTDRYDIRIDWAQNDKNSMYFVWDQAPRETSYPASFPDWGIGETSVYAPNPRAHATFGDTITPDPHWVINILLGWGRWTEQQIPSVTAPGTAVGFSQSLVSQFQAPQDLPQFTMSNYSTLGSYETLYHPESIRTLEVNVTRALGAHTLKFGYSMNYGYENGPGAGGWVTAPQFHFDQNMTSGPDVVPGTVTSGNSLASLLLGTGSGGGASYTAPLAESHHDYGLYVQDAWQVNQRLTVNLGLRWELQRPSTDRYDRYSSFATDVTSPLAAQTGLPLRGGLVFLKGTDLGRHAWDTEWKDFGPRVSLAYKITDKLVLRAGYGVFYMPLLGLGSLEGYSASTPWNNSVGGAGIIPLNLLSNPFPSGFAPVPGSSAGLLTDVGTGVPFQERKYPNGYVHNFSFDLQYQLPSNSVLEVGYIGTQSRHLTTAASVNLDQLPPQYLSLGNALNTQVPNPFYGTAGANGFLSGPTVARWRLLVPYPQFSGVSLEAPPAGNASYNSLLIKYTKRFSNGLSTLVNYEWSKAIDDASETQAWEIGDNGPRNAYNWNLERSLSAHDIPQRFAAAIVYDLPVGKGRKFGTNMNRVADAVVGGWQVSALMNFQTGVPVAMSAPGNGFGFAYQPPNITSGSDVPIGNPTIQEWFNTSAFSKPASFTIGTAPRRITQLRADGVHNVDFSISKSFAITEAAHVQIIGQFFNLTNTPQFNPPNTSVGSNSFGEVTSTYNQARDIQIGAKITF